MGLDRARARLTHARDRGRRIQTPTDVPAGYERACAADAVSAVDQCPAAVRDRVGDGFDARRELPLSRRTEVRYREVYLRQSGTAHHDIGVRLLIDVHDDRYTSRRRVPQRGSVGKGRTTQRSGLEPCEGQRSQPAPTAAVTSLLICSAAAVLNVRGFATYRSRNSVITAATCRPNSGVASNAWGASA